jgi:uncharacterized SAM-binding protein YcdF (DUF218 family)
MMLFISKLLPIFVYPLGLSLLLLAASIAGSLLNFRRVKMFAFAGAVLILWVSSTPLVAEWAASSLERQYPAKSMAETQAAEVAIVLGGAVGQPLPPRVETGLSEASDRVLHAARLYKAGKVKRILVTAGNIPWLSSVKPEADLIRELLMEWGVPSEAIELASQSRNTYENALEIKDIWQREGFESALLVTSAMHMPRAMATFLRAGLPVAASTADVRIIEAANPFALLPDVGALGTATNAMKEWLGLLAYKMLGYA